MRINILWILMFLFSVAFTGYAAGMIHEEDGASENADLTRGPAAPSFNELDVWQAQLREDARAVDEQRQAAERALAEANRLSTLATGAKEAELDSEVRARKLAAVYGAMDPVIAAQTIEGLPMDKAASIIAHMAPDLAGTILETMPPERSRKIADHLLGG